MGKEWRDILGYEGYYQVSSEGDVRALERVVCHNLSKKGVITLPARDRKVGANSQGYPAVQLSKENVKKVRLVHQLVCEAFSPNPNNYPQINHINGIKTDNRVENLEWCTPLHNMKHAHAMGLCKSQEGEANIMAKIKKEDVYDIRELREVGLGTYAIARELGLTRNQVAGVYYNYRWQSV